MVRTRRHKHVAARVVAARDRRFGRCVVAGVVVVRHHVAAVGFQQLHLGRALVVDLVDAVGDLGTAEPDKV